MKRLLALLLIAALAGAASATTLNFQNRGDNSTVQWHGTYLSDPNKPANINWVESVSGLNNYVDIKTYIAVGSGSTYACAMLSNPYQMTYAGMTAHAVTSTSTYNHPAFLLLDGSGNTLGFTDRSIPAAAVNVAHRYEVKISGGIPRYYSDGNLVYTGSAIATNPSYICMGQSRPAGGGNDHLAIDDLNWAEPNAMIMGLPESGDNQFVIMKDIITPASSGLWNTTSNTQANANYMTGTWSRGNATVGADVAQPNESIELRYLGTDQVYATNWTGTGLYGTMAWNIKTMLIDSGAPQGLYGLYRPKTGEWGDTIMYTSNGASVQWNQDEYSVGDTGTVIYYVLAGGYWDTSLYSYKVSIIDSYMNFIQNTTLTASSGNVAYEWTEDNPEGVYHAWLIATNHDGYEYVLGSDYAELVAYFGYWGFVNDGYTELPIEGANVNITQGLTALHNASSGYDGNYSTSPLFSTGSSVFFNVTKSGYNPYQYSFVPLSSGTIRDLNVTIYPSDIYGVEGGVGIGGVIRDATIGRPIQGANVSLTNVSNSQQYFKLTNMAGGYLCDVGTSCSLVSGRVYSVNASKVGYNTSVDYQVTA